MTVEDPVAYCAGLWDWKILAECFPGTKIKPTDIDGAVERNYKFLWIETKAPEVVIPQGQEIFYKRLAKRGDLVLIVWSTTNEPVALRMLYRNAQRDIDPCDLPRLQEVVTNWFKWANQ